MGKEKSTTNLLAELRSSSGGVSIVDAKQVPDVPIDRFVDRHRGSVFVRRVSCANEQAESVSEKRGQPNANTVVKSFCEIAQTTWY
jgi:hypothetical protein